MIWYIIGAVVIVGLILYLTLGKKKTKKEDEVEGGQIDGGETKIIEPIMEDDSQDVKSEEETDILPDELSAPAQDETTDEGKTI